MGDRKHTICTLSSQSPKTPEQIDAAIRQLVSKAITPGGQVFDVFTAAGLAGRSRENRPHAGGASLRRLVRKVTSGAQGAPPNFIR